MPPVRSGQPDPETQKQIEYAWQEFNRASGRDTSTSARSAPNPALLVPQVRAAYQRAVKAEYDQLQAKINAEIADYTSLYTNQNTTSQQLARMNQQLAERKHALEVATAEAQRIQAEITRLENEPIPSCEDQFCEVGRRGQRERVQAQRDAIEQTIRSLDNLLKNGAITLNDYLSLIRDQSKVQFECILTLDKINRDTPQVQAQVTQIQPPQQAQAQPYSQAAAPPIPPPPPGRPAAQRNAAYAYA